VRVLPAAEKIIDAETVPDVEVDPADGAALL
jgi:hypothetical protein